MLHTHFHTAVTLMRGFFASKGCIEVHPQSRRSILAACEDPETIQTFDWQNQTWPLPQTGQMRLEYELLQQPDVPGFFCVSTSYRNEPDPIPGRHETIFPMFEFEVHGGMETMIQWEMELLEWMGFDPGVKLSYDEVAGGYGVKELTHAHEYVMQRDYNPVVYLTDFPQYTSPFWNMKKDGEYAKKVDVIMYGMETIGSAERSCDKDEMREQFLTISNGEYAGLLYNRFGEERVNAELEEFLSHDFFPRSGGGIGIGRMISAMEKAGLFTKHIELAGLRMDVMKKTKKEV